MRPKSSLPLPKKKAPVPVRGQAAHEIRIIGGQWRRTPIKVLDKPGLRPTPDRVRETLFNWLGQDLSGWRCVDAFAGTGALGLEAASRGAAQVIALEQDPELSRQLQQLSERLKATMVQVQRTDAVAAMQRLPQGAFDAVFLDPPFDGPWFEPALKAAEAWTDEALASLGLQVMRHLKAGAVHAHLLQRTA